VTIHSAATPATPAQIALCKLAVGLVTAAREGRDAFNSAFSAMFGDICRDERHVLRNATNADLLWAVITLLSAGEDPVELAEYLQICGRTFAAWPVSEVG